VGLGLMGLFDAFPVSYQVLKVLSVSYLLFLAWKIATATPVITDSQQTGTRGKPFTFIQAALFQWVNPKAWAMALTAVTAYTPESQPWISVVLVALIFGTVNLPSVITWVVLGTQLKRFLNNTTRLRVFNFTAAGLLLGSLYPILF
jgi:threonine/homoserine/homoserine lactone efflux protein